MTLVGYGITVNGKPSGTWPVSLSYAQSALDRYRKSAPEKKVEIVPVYHGTPVPAAVNHEQQVYA